MLPVVLLLQGAAFWYFGLYRGIWRFASIPDLVRIVKAVATGVVVSAVVIFLWTRLEGVPRSVFVLDAVLLGLLLGGPRMLYRWLKDRHLYLRDGKRALIVGAGQAGEMLLAMFSSWEIKTGFSDKVLYFSLVIAIVLLTQVMQWRRRDLLFWLKLPRINQMVYGAAVLFVALYVFMSENAPVMGREFIYFQF